MPDVRLVVNLDAAQNKEEYLHRAGRASRWSSNPGLIINFGYEDSQVSIDYLVSEIESLVQLKDNVRVETRLAKEMAISDQNVKSLENVEACE